MGVIIPIHFMGPINVSTVEVLRNMLLNSLRIPNIEAVEIMMSSDGGDLNPGFLAYNYIRSMPIKTIAVNMGSIESMAVMPFLACSERRAVKDAKFMLHNFHWGFGNTKVFMNQMQEYNETLQFDMARYAEIYDERTLGAVDPINVRMHLTGPSAVIGARRAFSAGITTTEDDAFPALSPVGEMWSRLFA